MVYTPDEVLKNPHKKQNKNNPDTRVVVLGRFIKNILILLNVTLNMFFFTEISLFRYILCLPMRGSEM